MISPLYFGINIIVCDRSERLEEYNPNITQAGSARNPDSMAEILGLTKIKGPVFSYWCCGLVL
jgi:hypothetical protein